ncbi:MAG: hypothetical protein IH851_13965 [Armatimonadetes bacterium]|nr:hypothetical protein [Armatimonadota bacterium]
MGIPPLLGVRGHDVDPKTWQWPGFDSSDIRRFEESLRKQTVDAIESLFEAA